MDAGERAELLPEYLRQLDAMAERQQVRTLRRAVVASVASGLALGCGLGFGGVLALALLRAVVGLLQ